MSGLETKFREMCGRASSAPTSPLREDARASLQEAVDYGMNKSGRLLMTDVYEFLARKKELGPSHASVRAARTAYMLNAPLHLTFDVSLPTDDIDVALASFFGSRPGEDDQGLSFLVPIVTFPTIAAATTLLEATPLAAYGLAISIATASKAGADYLIDSASERRAERLGLLSGTIHGSFRLTHRRAAGKPSPG